MSTSARWNLSPALKLSLRMSPRCSSVVRVTLSNASAAFDFGRFGSGRVSRLPSCCKPNSDIDQEKLSIDLVNSCMSHSLPGRLTKKLSGELDQRSGQQQRRRAEDQRLRREQVHPQLRPLAGEDDQ